LDEQSNYKGTSPISHDSFFMKQEKAIRTTIYFSWKGKLGLLFILGQEEQGLLDSFNDRIIRTHLLRMNWQRRLHPQKIASAKDCIGKRLKKPD